MVSVARRLNESGIRYFITGSMASMSYSEWRTTNDVDIVISVSMRDLQAIMGAFDPEQFYIDDWMVSQAIQHLRSFNVIDKNSVNKIDFMVVDEDGYDASRFSRRKQVVFDGVPIWIAAPEDVILKKLVFYREGQSDKHLRDIASMLKVSGDIIDRAYIDQWSLRLGVAREWRYLVDRVEGREPGPTV